jgi:hypothetical protein
MKRILLAAAAALLGCASQAQTYHDAGSTVVPGVVPLVGCSTSGNCTAPVSSTNPLPVQGLVSSSISGFQPSATGSVATPIIATTAGAVGNLPSGTVVIATNAGATNTAYCQLGSSASISAQPIAPNGGWFAFTVGSATQLACATSTSTTTVNLLGGSGLPTGTGGGGGGASGTVTVSTSSPGGAAANPSYLANNPVGTTNFSPNQVSCTSSATSIAAARVGNPGTGRIAILVEQLGTVNVYLGGSGVTTSTGFLLPGVVGATVTLPITAALYCITSGTSQSIAFTELY